MGNDIEITVRVGNQTTAGIQSVNQSLRSLKNNARDAGQALSTLTARATAAAAALQVLQGRSEAASRSLRELRGRAAAAGAALGELRDGATGTNNSLRTLNTRTEDADGRLNTLSDRTRTLRGDMDGLDGSLRRLIPNMGGLQGSLGTLRTSTGNAGGGMQKLKAAALALSPALIPIGAAAVSVGAQVAAGLGAAAVAVGAFGAALLPQVVGMAKAQQAQTKYTEAVAEHGKASDEAAKAEREYLRAVEKLPPVVREAAAAFGVLKGDFKDWSASLAGDTVPVMTKSFATFGALLPRLTPLVRGASAELDRMMTVIAGGVRSNGFKQMMDDFAVFASGALSKATDGLVRFGRAISEGTGSGALTDFMAYVRDVGPLVAETLGNLSGALLHLVESASGLGVGILTVVNAFAGLVNAIPTELLSGLLQFVFVLKAVKLAAAGLGGAGGIVAAFSAQIAAAGAAAAGASGGLASLTAAFAALSRGAKLAVIGTGVGLLVIALSELSSIGKKAPPDVDKLTTSLGKLGQTGKVTGEAAKAFGADLGGLADSLRTLARPSNAEGIQQWLTRLIKMDSTPVADAKENLSSLDQALASLVKGGNADLADAAFKRAAAAMEEQGLSSQELSKELSTYEGALADAAFEAQLTADAMGLFGQQALSVQEKLNAQKLSADGLRQSIQALNDVNRAGLGGMIGFEAAIDAATKAAKENAGSLRMVHGQLDLNSTKAQNAATALNDLAAKTDAAASSARESGASWSTVNGIYDRGRTKLIAAAEAMGLNRDEAKKLASQILKTPDKTARLKGNLEDLQAKLASAKKQLKSVPDARKAKVKATITQLQDQVRKAKAALRSIKDESVTITTYSKYVSVGKRPGEGTVLAPGKATGGITGAAGGGARGGMSWVGEQGPELVRLPYGSTVYPAGQSRQMAAAGGGGGGQPIQVNLILDGKPIARALIDPLRGEIRSISGGDVQKALGRN